MMQWQATVNAILNEACISIDATKEQHCLESMVKYCGNVKHNQNCVIKVVVYNDQPQPASFVTRDIKEGEQLIYNYADTIVHWKQV